MYADTPYHNVWIDKYMKPTHCESKYASYDT